MLFLLVFDYDSAQDLVGVSYAESSRIRDRVEIEVEAEVSTNAKGLREAQGKAAKMKGVSSSMKSFSVRLNVLEN